MRTGTWRMAGLAVLAASLQAGAALAADQPTLAIIAVDPAVPRPLDRDVVGELLLQGAQLSGMSALNDGVGAARTRVLLGARPVAESVFLGDAAARVREAWRAYHLVDAVRALSGLDAADALYASHLEWPGLSDLLADVALRRGAVELLAGRALPARDALRRARTLDPDRSVGPEEFHPDVVRLVSEVDAERLHAPGALLLVNASPSADEIWVDGEWIGAGARASVTLAPGRHLVWASSAGRRSAGALVELGPAGAETSLQLAADPRLALLDGALTNALATIMELLGVDEVVVGAVAWRGGQLTAVGQRCAAAPLGCGAIREVRVERRSELTQGALALMTTLERGSGPLTVLEAPALKESQPPSALVPLGAGTGAPPVTPPSRGRPWYKRGWVWAVAGGAALAAGTAALLAASAETSHSRGIDVAPGQFSMP